MAKKINQTNKTPRDGKVKQSDQQVIEISEEKAKELLSKRNTTSKLNIIQGPVGCLLGMTLFDQSPEVQRIGALSFRILAEVEEAKIAIPYFIRIDKSQPGVDGADIVVPGTIIMTPEDTELPLSKEKFTFLPEGTEVKIKYNQDKGTGDITIVSYPFDILETTSKQDIHTLLKEGETTVNIVSRVVGELNANFLAIQDGKKEMTKKDSELEKTKNELNKSLDMLKDMKNKEYAQEVSNAIKNSPEYQKVQSYEEEKIRKQNSLPEQEKGFKKAETLGLRKITAFTQQQEAYVKKISRLLNEYDFSDEIKLRDLTKLLIEACKDGIFIITDNFIAQDSYQHVYRNIKWDDRPKYVTGYLNLETTMKTVVLLSEIQEKYPTLLQETGIVEQVKKSVRDRADKVQENVKNKRYNPFTRSDAIRYTNLWQMLGKVCGDDGTVLDNMIRIFDLLIEQRHHDGTNSSTFSHTVQENIHEYIQQNKKLLGKDIVYTINAMKYMDSEDMNELRFHDIDSEFWMSLLAQGLKNPEVEKTFLDFLDQSKKKGTITKSSFFPDVNLGKYIDFIKTFFQTKKYMLRQGGIVDNSEITRELRDLYTKEIASDKEAQ